MPLKSFFLFILITLSCTAISAQEIALLQYEGGGDWYANPTALPNLVKFCNANISTDIKAKPATVSSTDVGIMQYPFVHMTGHGNVFFSPDAVNNLRNYLESGGFLYIDDNYGMDKFIRTELKKIFPNEDLQQLPSDHPVFSNAFNFPNGLPKIHEHDGLRAEAYGIFKNGRMVVMYTTESDIGDGWESAEVHNDPEEVRQKALKMGANIIKYAFEN